ncbi:alpha-hydroxy acid oxidase [Sedimentitalea todarodis]|uniref:Alpha-hydroxy acid oxidase n=1 Tax=Sedimentitalea todarodis TaxID=1631240 RepID=A0ABU3V933_9RHOB|nr:alpha-hydroxy acid oxidase [Sedimentitalea todarodis]MDU9002545.1 alpha-hydroxy acid oxidase [Sedimentitalea todarodis]
MDFHGRYPGLIDLKWRAKRRLPKFVWEYLDSGTGAEATKSRNRAALDRIGFAPSILHGAIEPDISTTLLGQTYRQPFGVSPIGMSGLIWPDAEALLAQAAAQAGMPFCMSTVASASPEDIAPHLGPDAWFQLYPPKAPEIRRDLLDRARTAGFCTLVLTVDVPVASRRERQTRSGLTQPPRLTPRLLAQVGMRPVWAAGMARRGMPRMRTLDKYITGAQANLPPTAHIGYILRTSPDMEYVRWLRDHWDGPFVLKGIMRPEDAAPLEQIGIDALWVSNHAGRQFDGSLSSIEVLPAIRAETTLPLLFDSGIESGLDILRALALGADFVMLGRGFHFALAALGADGPPHLVDLLTRDMQANMGQIGAHSLQDLPDPIELPTIC